MIDNLDQFKDFITWCREHGVRAVKFTEGKDCRPVDVVFWGPDEQAASWEALGEPGTDHVPHAPYPEEPDEREPDEPAEPSEEELYASSG